MELKKRCFPEFRTHPTRKVLSRNAGSGSTPAPQKGKDKKAQRENEQESKHGHFQQPSLPPVSTRNSETWPFFSVQTAQTRLRSDFFQEQCKRARLLSGQSAHQTLPSTTKPLRPMATARRTCAVLGHYLPQTVNAHHLQLRR